MGCGAAKTADGMYYHAADRHRYKVHKVRTHTEGMETNPQMDLIRYEVEWQRNWADIHEETLHGINGEDLHFFTSNPWVSTSKQFVAEDMAHAFVKLVLDDQITAKGDVIDGPGFVQDTHSRRTQQHYAS